MQETKIYITTETRNACAATDKACSVNGNLTVSSHTYFIACCIVTEAVHKVSAGACHDLPIRLS